MVGTKKQNKVAFTEWEEWLNTTSEGQAAVTKWPDCDSGECDEECDRCLWNLVGLEEDVGEFLERVKTFVEEVGFEVCRDSGGATEYLANLYVTYELA